MTIAKKGNRLVVKRGLLARNCQCCRPNNTCGVTCPQSLEDIAQDITVTVTIIQHTEMFFFNPNPFFDGQVITCTFSRLQTSIVGPMRYAAYSSDPSVSESSGLTTAELYSDARSAEMQASMQSMQQPQQLVEVFVPCNPSINFGSDRFVIVKLFQTWRWADDNIFATSPFRDEYDLRTNLEPTFQSQRPFINCQFALSQPQSPNGYPYSYFPSGNTVPGRGFVNLQIQVNPLP